MIIRYLFLPFRCLHVFLVALYALFHYLIARAFFAGTFDLGVFYQRNLERLGATYIKVGQVLSVRYDVLSAEQCQALSKLQDNVKPFNAERGIRIIERELKGTSSQGLTIDPKPFAAGSLCQVYRATHEDGQVLAIKVKRPFIEAKLFADTFCLNIVKYLFILTGVGKRLKAYKVIDEVIEVLWNELDYHKETGQIELFQPIAERIPNLVVPKVYRKWCTSRVLTMDLIPGTPLSYYIAHEDERPFDDNEICKTIYDIYIQCIFREGTFHADPHPGNIFIMEDGKIGLVDFGIIGVLNKKIRQKNFNYLWALSQANTEKAAEIYGSILIANRNSNMEALLRDTKLELDLYLKRVQDPDSGLIEKSSANLYTNSISFARKYNFTFPENVFLFYKTLFTLDSILLRLHPAFDAKSATAKSLTEISRDKFLEGLSYESIITRLKDIPEMIESIPELLKLAKSSLEERTQENQKSKWNDPAHATGVLARILIFAAILFPALYFSNALTFITMGAWSAGLISVSTLLVGLRLKQ